MIMPVSYQHILNNFLNKEHDLCPFQMASEYQIQLMAYGYV